MIEVKGNGNIVSREISVSSFLRLHIGCKGIVELIQSDEEKVVMEMDENLQEFGEAGNAGRTLYVSTEGKLRRPAPTHCIVRIYLRQIDTLVIRNDHADLVCPAPLTLSNPLDVKLQTVGNTSLNVIAPTVKVLNQSTGNLTLAGQCGIISIKNMAQGNLDASALRAGELTITNMAEGNVDLYAEKSISISHYGQGYVHYAGDAALKDVKQFGDGEVKHVNKPAASL